MKRFNGLLIIFVAILSSTLSVALFVSIWPYLDILGKLFIGFAAVVIGCATLLAIISTWHWIGILAARRRREDLHSRLIATDGVVVLTKSDGSYLHLSSEHEAAKVKMLPAPVQVTEVDKTDEDYDVKVARLKMLYDNGLVHVRDLMKATGYTQYFVQQITAPWRGWQTGASTKYKQQPKKVVEAQSQDD